MSENEKSLRRILYTCAYDEAHDGWGWDHDRCANHAFDAVVDEAVKRHEASKPRTPPSHLMDLWWQVRDETLAQNASDIDAAIAKADQAVRDRVLGEHHASLPPDEVAKLRAEAEEAKCDAHYGAQLCSEKLQAEVERLRRELIVINQGWTVVKQSEMTRFREIERLKKELAEAKSDADHYKLRATNEREFCIGQGEIHNRQVWQCADQEARIRTILGENTNLRSEVERLTAQRDTAWRQLRLIRHDMSKMLVCVDVGLRGGEIDEGNEDKVDG